MASIECDNKKRVSPLIFISLILFFFFLILDRSHFFTVILSCLATLILPIVIASKIFGYANTYSYLLKIISEIYVEYENIGQSPMPSKCQMTSLASVRMEEAKKLQKSHPSQYKSMDDIGQSSCREDEITPEIHNDPDDIHVRQRDSLKKEKQVHSRECKCSENQNLKSSSKDSKKESPSEKKGSSESPNNSQYKNQVLETQNIILDGIFKSLKENQEKLQHDLYQNLKGLFDLKVGKFD